MENTFIDNVSQCVHGNYRQPLLLSYLEICITYYVIVVTLLFLHHRDIYCQKRFSTKINIPPKDFPPPKDLPPSPITIDNLGSRHHLHCLEYHQPLNQVGRLFVEM